MNNRIKSRYLRVMLLSLLFLLTAGQAMAEGSGIYLRGGMNEWKTPPEWEFKKNSTENVYTLKGVTISQGTEFKIGKSNWDDLSCGKMDNESSTLNPNSTIKLYNNTGSGNLTAGSGLTNVTLTLDLSVDPPTLKAEYNYYLKHPWGGGDWTWKELTANGDGTYSLDANYGGDNAGFNWGTTTSSTTYIDPTSNKLIRYGNPAKGDECTFTLNPTAETITITKKVTKVETPTFSVAGGTYDAAQSVTIACATEGATIYYTTDGSAPTTSSNQYTGEIAVSETTTIKAIAVKDGMTDSEVAEATYTINIPTPTAPVVKIHGGLAIGSNSAWDGSGSELTGNDGVYEYTFTKRSADWNDYFFVTIDGKRIQETNESNNKEVVLNTTYTWKESTGNSAQFYIKDGILTNGNSYTVVINTNDNTIRVNGNTAPVVDPKTGDLYIKVADGDYTAMTKNADGNFTWTGNISNDQIIKFSSNGTDATEYHLASSGNGNYWVNSNNQTDNNPKFGAGSDYIMENGDGEYTVTVGSDYDYVSFVKTVVPETISKVYLFGELDNDTWNESNLHEMANNGEGVYTYEFTAASGHGTVWAFKAETNLGTTKYPAPATEKAQVALNDETGVGYNLLDNRGNLSYECTDIHTGGVYVITLNTVTGKVTIKRTGGITAYDIPVYPRGVQSETELEAYDFASNPVVYLLAEVLNHERISPEWQMTKGADGKYHLDGFAMRTTNCHTHNGDKTEEKTVFVRKFTAIDSHEDVGGTTVDLGNVHLSEGKLYNAVFDAQSNVLTLTEDESANGRMPFISLVGNEMKQDQNYDTPRGSKSDYGWQEAWLQYDENGKLLKDRRGNVMYSTMWPPKNPIYFTANIGGERLYSSEQMAFKAQNNYVAKKGSVWKTELQAAENGEAYNHLDTGDFKLEDDVEYVRYVVPDIWYVGAAKIWTGWTGRTNDNGDAQWSNHRNWGYGNKELGSGDAGTPVEAEMPYYLSTEKDHNGNFYFEKPTYFKTIEFFYNTSDYNKSRLYTTLAFGNAQIEAQSHKEGDAYDRGMYKPTVTPGEGVTIQSYIIRCYDAATNELVTLNNGIVAQDNQGNSPSSLTFVNDALGLAEGKYYYEMEVVFQTAAGTRTATVKSNPFIIHFPGVYTLEPVALQLVKAGDTYVTYNKNTENAPLFRATINESNELTAVVPVAESERNGLFTMFKSNTGFDWTDKVLVVAPVPAQFKLDAEKAATVMSIEDYTLNTNLTVNKAVDGSMAYLDNAGKFTDKVYTAVMNYKEDVNSEVKHSMAKPASALMMRPNPKANGEVVVTVSQPGTIGSVSTIDGMTVPADAQYYTVSVEMPFGAANVTADASAPKYIAVMGGKTAELSQAGTVTFNNVNPETFANDIKVTAVYPDGNGNYLEANVGNPVSCNGETDGFKKNAQISFTGNFEPVFNNGQAGVKEIHMSVPQGVYDAISDNSLEMQYFKTQAFLGEDKKEVLNKLFIDEELNFAGYITNSEGHQITRLRFNVDGITLTEGMPVSMKATPVYFVKVDESISVPGNGAAHSPALMANEATYVALYGNEAVVEPTTDGIVTGVNDITVDGVKAYKVIENGQVIIVRGSERFNIMGQPVR